MRILLDTHLLLWSHMNDRRLSQTVRELLESRENDVYFSAASIWEIAIKAQLKRLESTVDPQQIVRAALDSDFEELPVTASSAVLVSALPMHHRDPFDRLLVAQAMSVPLTLMTADPQLLQYSELVRLV